MAESLYFNDGSVEYLFNKHDTPEFYDRFQQIIYEKLGRDAELIIEELREAADYTTQKVMTDLNSYEASLESQRNCFQDILENLEQMKDLLQNGKRINKSELVKLVTNAIKEINNEI